MSAWLFLALLLSCADPKPTGGAEDVSAPLPRSPVEDWQGPAIDVVGTLLDQHGQPVVGATIRWGTVETVSLSSGAYFIRDLQPSSHEVSVTLGDWTSRASVDLLAQPARQRFLLAAELPEELDIGDGRHPGARVLPTPGVVSWAESSSLGDVVLAYRGRDSEGTDIRVLAPEGVIRWDRAMPREQRRPRWSPDGTMLVYQEVVPEGADEVRLLRRGRATPTFVAYGRTPVWSPDGRHVALARLVEGRHRLVVQAWSGGSEHVVGPDDVDVRDPDWGMVGEDDWMVFLGTQDGVQRLWRMRSDGGEASEIACEGVEAELRGPRLSPDGDHVLFWTQEGDASVIWAVPFDGGKASQLVRGGTRPAWAPDGAAMWFIDDGALTSAAYRAELTREANVVSLTTPKDEAATLRLMRQHPSDEEAW